MRIRIITALLSYFILILSVNMYTDWRGYDHGLFYWSQKIFRMDLPTDWVHVFGVDNVSIMLYNVPDGLWMLALLGFITALWGFSENRIRFFWLFMALLLGVSLEFFQYTGKIPGTFDRLDMYAYAVAFGLVIIFSQVLKYITWKSG